MSRRFEHLKQRYGRRQFLKNMGLGVAGIAGAGLLNACAPAGTAPAASSQGDSGGAAAAIDSPWITGLVSSDSDATFKYTGWEGEAEMRKWLFHFDNFFGDFYPNVNVQGDWGVPWGDYWTKMPTQLAAGAAIDMMWMHDTRGPSFANNGWLLSLDEYLESHPIPDWPDAFYATQVKAFQWEGKQYGIPYDWAPGGFYVNKDLFDEAGIALPTEDTTMEALMDMAIALTKRDASGDVTQWGVNLPTGSGGIYWLIKNFGGDFWNEEITESRFNDPATIEAFQYVSDLIWKHGAMPSSTQMQGIGLDAGTAFASGLLAMHYSLNDEAFALAEVVEGKFNWGVAPTPKGSAGRFQFVGGSAFSIPTSSSQPDMAYELIRWALGNLDNLKISAEMGSQFVGRKDIFEFGIPQPETGLDGEEFKHAMYTLGQRDGIHPVYHPKYLEWDPSVYSAIFSTMWVGEETDAAVVCQQAHEATNELLQA